MKQVVSTMILILILLTTAGCKNKNDSLAIEGYKGLGAEILELTREVKGMVVKSTGNNSVLGEKCYINCENAYFVYVNNDTVEVIQLTFDDFIVGDIITFDIDSLENIELLANKFTITSRVQLMTQRK